MLRLTVDVGKITDNFRHVASICETRGLSLAVVIKLCLSRLDIVEPLIEAGARLLADTNLENFARLGKLGNRENRGERPERLLLRSSLTQIQKGLDFCDYVFLSETALVEALGQSKRGREVGVYVSVEAGDMRDGVTAEELPGFVAKAASGGQAPRIVGFAANYGCLSGFVPVLEDLARLRELCDRAARRAGLVDYGLSMGGTTIFDMIADGSLDGIADQVRIGEAIFFGYNMSLGKRIPGLHSDALVLTGEAIEVKEKLVSPREAEGLNAFGEKAKPQAPGYRKRVILNFGELAAPIKGLEALAPGAFFVGATHDYAVLDVTDCANPPRPGDAVHFRTNYNSAAQAMLSPYVEKMAVRRPVYAREGEG